MSRYLVTSLREYRGYKPGEEFEARIDEAAERRAIARGAIKLLERSTTKLKRGSYTLPKERRG